MEGGMEGGVSSGHAHHIHIAGGDAYIVRPATCQIDKVRDHVTLNLGRVDEIGHAKTLGHGFLVGIDVNADDLICAGEAQALDHV